MDHTAPPAHGRWPRRRPPAPTAPTRMHGRDGLETFFLAGGLVQPGIAFVGSRQNKPGRCVTHATSILVRSSACTNPSGDVPGTLRQGYAPRNALQSIRISRSKRARREDARGIFPAHQRQIVRGEKGLEIAKLGQPVSMVMSVPHSRRFTPALSRTASSMPPSSHSPTGRRRRWERPPRRAANAASRRRRRCAPG